MIQQAARAATTGSLTCLMVRQRSMAMLQGIEWMSFNPSNPEQALVQTLKYMEALKTKKVAAQAVLALGALIVAAFALSGKGRTALRPKSIQWPGDSDASPPPPAICMNIKGKDLQNLHFVID